MSTMPATEVFGSVGVATNTKGVKDEVVISAVWGLTVEETLLIEKLYTYCTVILINKMIYKWYWVDFFKL